MALSDFGSLTREFYIAEIGTWENYGGKRVRQFIGGRYNEVLLYICLEGKMFFTQLIVLT